MSFLVEVFLIVAILNLLGSGWLIILKIKQTHKSEKIKQLSEEENIYPDYRG